MKIKSVPSKLKYVLLAAAITLALGIGYFVYASSQDDSSGRVGGDIERSVNDVDYEDASEDETSEIDRDQDERNRQREELDKLPPATNADIVVASAAQYGDTVEVRAYIPNLYESGGECTATYTKSGSNPLSVTKPAIQDAKTIQCGALDIPSANFSPTGSWNVIVTYKSPQAAGTSETKTISVE